MSLYQRTFLGLVPIAVLCLFSSSSSFCEQSNQSPSQQSAKSAPARKTPPANAPSETELLQQAIESAGNDRAALVRNLEGFLKQYPESQQRPQIYRALVEASLQLRDSTRATDYAERIVALAPEDISMTVLAIQLLDRNGDEAGLRRALSYSTRVLEYVERNDLQDKSPKISQEEWEAERKRDKVNILVLRGGLAFKLHENAAAEKDFRESMALSPTASAAEKLGEIAELRKDLPGAIQDYAKAFALTNATSTAGRREVRQELGNAWRLAHGSDEGLGDYLLHAFDEVASSSEPPKHARNLDAKDPHDFILRKAPDGAPYQLSNQKGKIIVLNFWATWCGPCHELEPHFDRVAAQFQGIPDIVFLAADCDEDESLVPEYLQEEKPRTTVVFADGLDHLLGVRALPTIIILDRAGKIAYRAEGFDPDAVEVELSAAVRRIMAGQNESAPKPSQGVKSPL